MSRPSGAGLALAAMAAAALAGPGAAAAQVQRSEAQIEERIRELTAQYWAADALADVADAAEVARRQAGMDPQDTVLVGPLRVVTTADQVDEVEEMWQAEWAFFEPLLGEHARDLGGAIFIHHRRPVAFPYQIASGELATIQFRRPVADVVV